jgi:hypothetical protein
MKIAITQFESLVKGTAWNADDAKQTYGEPSDVTTNASDGSTVYGYILPGQGHIIVNVKDGEVQNTWIHKYIDNWTPKQGELVEYSRPNAPDGVKIGVFAGFATVGTATFAGLHPVLSFVDENEYEAANAVMYVNPMYLTTFCPVGTAKAAGEEMRYFNNKLNVKRMEAEAKSQPE